MKTPVHKSQSSQARIACCWHI